MNIAISSSVRWGLCSVLLLLLPTVVLAKRAPPNKIVPLVTEGVRYTIPNDNGRRAYLVATDDKTGKQLWELTLFTNTIKPDLEEDVQWVFVDRAKLDGRTLIAVSESNKTYRVDLDAKKVAAE